MNINGATGNATNRALNHRGSARGMFTIRAEMKFRDVIDGLSNTIACGEIATDLGDRDIRTMPAIGGGQSVACGNMNSVTRNPSAARAGFRDWIDPMRPTFWRDTTPIGETYSGRGFRWANKAAVFTTCNMILPPNSECVAAGLGIDSDGIMPPASRHQGGAHVLMGDGAVRFITDSIDAGTATNCPAGMFPSLAGPPCDGSGPGVKSPFGVWGALGSRAASEVIDNEGFPE